MTTPENDAVDAPEGQLPPRKKKPSEIKLPTFPVADSLPLFKAFDAAADAEAASPAPKEVEDSVARLAALIDKLPQRKAIKDEHATNWLHRTYRTAVERMELEHGEGNATVEDVHNHVFWHVRRASGIGGSEAGTVLKHYRGKKGTFGDAKTLVMEKLLILSPQPSTPEMARGVRAEPWVQRMYHEQHQVESHSDLDMLKNFRWDKRPASIGTPDDIVQHTIGPFAGMKRCLDYKAPSAAVMEEYERDGVSEDYTCQVHHYGILELAAGSRFDVMSIEAFDPRSFQIVSFPVPFDKEFAKEIADSSHRVWHEHVMMGLIPDAPEVDTLDVEDEALVNIGVQAAFLKVLEDDIGKRRKDLIEKISIMGSEWHDLAEGKMELSVGSFARKRKWDEEKLRDIAAAADIDISPFNIPDKKGKIDADEAAEFLTSLHELLSAEDADGVQKLLEDYREEGAPIVHKLDVDKLAQHLEDVGVNCITAAGVGESFRLSTKKKGPEADRLAYLRMEVSQLVEHLESLAEEQAPKIVDGSFMEDDEPDQDLEASMI